VYILAERRWKKARRKVNSISTEGFQDMAIDQVRRQRKRNLVMKANWDLCIKRNSCKDKNYRIVIVNRLIK